MNNQIFQIYYLPDQLKYLEKSFTPYDNAGKVYPFNFEYAVFFDVYSKADWSSSEYLGAVSWKFKAKTGMTGEHLTDFIKENPGYDVYFVNPFPELSIYRSVWEHGDEFHPNLTEITSKLLKRCGYSDSILMTETPPNKTAYCNYWVGNKKFWDEYIKFLEPLWTYISENDDDLTQSLGKLADPLIQAPYAPFIFERLFSTFISNREFKTISIPTHNERRSNYRVVKKIWRMVDKVTTFESNRKIPLRYKLVIKAFIKLTNLKFYYLPVLKKRLKVR